MICLYVLFSAYRLMRKRDVLVFQSTIEVARVDQNMSGSRRRAYDRGWGPKKACYERG